MRRKVLQDFANVACQMFLTSMTNYDRINLVIFGSGELWIDFLNERCTHNNLPISPLHYCYHYREWLQQQCDRHSIDIHSLSTAELTASVIVETFRRDTGYRGWLTTSMDVVCSSMIVMDGVKYRGEKSDSQNMGLGEIIHGRSY